ncbi:MAG: hypothetical protein A2X83_09000 [Desulfuromonadales bacterium GWD2_54_10]|nr:MAG: hypothetical protein A2X83_09000 [Desulfuromonadales bacterium GWD2_54_10]
MKTPTVDIIVPVWNSPFETRACLAAILEYSPDARLIIVDNGSSRETELMLEEFSETLGERGLFIKSERNVGMVPAINIGLARSDSDFAVILRPHMQVTRDWLSGLLDAAQAPQAGIVSPVFSGSDAPRLPAIAAGSTQMETFDISFAALALKGELHMLIGGFDEGMDGGEWCLKDYVRRAWSRGYHTCATSRSRVVFGKEPVFGSDLRRQQQLHSSRTSYLERWGIGRHYSIYFGNKTDACSLADSIETILEGARQGHRFTLLLHRRQASDFRRMGWNALHTGITLKCLSLLMPQRDLLRQFSALQTAVSDVIPVQGVDNITFPGADTAIPFHEIAAAIGSIKRGTS